MQKYYTVALLDSTNADELIWVPKAVFLSLDNAGQFMVRMDVVDQRKIIEVVVELEDYINLSYSTLYVLYSTTDDGLEPTAIFSDEKSAISHASKAKTKIIIKSIPNLVTTIDLDLPVLCIS